MLTSIVSIKGCNNLCTYDANLWHGDFMQLTIGLNLTPGLWIFLRPYILGGTLL